MKLLGVEMDQETRCKHYHLEVDRIAIKFACCDTYYPCYQCHEELAGHPAVRMKLSQADQLGVLCGGCQTELTINEYLNSNNQCPKCGKSFNPGCKLHKDIYWEDDL